MNPHRLTWGVAYDFPFAQLIAVATLLGVFIMALREGKLPKVPWERETILLVLLWSMFILTTFFALRQDLAWPRLADISKIMLITFLTIALIKDERRLRYLLLLIALSLGFYGFKGGVFAIVTGGQHMVYGPPNSFIDDNTSVGLALNMILPLLFYLAKSEEKWWLKRILQLTFFLTILAILFTYSRGAWLGLLAVLGLIFLTFTLRTKIIITVILLFLLPVALVKIPEKVVDRMVTIQAYEQDSSAQARLGAWKTAWLVVVNRPFTGGGFQIIDDHNWSRFYNPEHTPGMGGVHSIYFEVLAENGFITFGIYLLLLVLSILSAGKVRRDSRRLGLDKYYAYGCMLQTAFVGYAVSGAFLEFASFDLFYHFIAIAILVKIFARQELAKLQDEGAHDETINKKMTTEKSRLISTKF
jgi:probable O-glycosylation ligase (exosortase A-associated)